jgi:FAD synthetase
MKEKKKSSRSKTVLATGVFDLLHYGHLLFLEEAKKAGGDNAKLVVVVARDKTTERRKKVKPVISEEQRRLLIAALKPVDEAMLGLEDFSIRDILKKTQPDIIAVGYDQDDIYDKVRQFIETHRVPIELIRIKRFGPEDDGSSSVIKKRVVEEWRTPES